MISIRRLTILFCFFAAKIFAQAERTPKGGDMAGNGGGVVVCGEPSGTETDKIEAGVYSNDYMQTRDSQEFISPGSLEESFAHVDKLLALVPEMRANFAAFRGLIGNESPDVGNRIWKPSNAKLKEIDDHDSVRTLPENCVASKENPSHGLYQLVIRKVTGLSIYYEVQKVFLEKLEKLPLQLSMLYTHEWLWDYVKPDQAYMTRLLNAALHDKNTTPDEIVVMIDDFQMALTVKAPIRRKGVVEATLAKTIASSSPAAMPAPSSEVVKKLPYHPDFETRARESLKTYMAGDTEYRALCEQLEARLSKFRNDNVFDDLFKDVEPGAAILLCGLSQIDLHEQQKKLGYAWANSFEESETQAGRALPHWGHTKEKLVSEMMATVSGRVEECNALTLRHLARLKARKGGK